MITTKEIELILIKTFLDTFNSPSIPRAKPLYDYEIEKMEYNQNFGQYQTLMGMQPLIIHECDLLLYNNIENHFTEIEIKISKSDILKDLKKNHGHIDFNIKELYFCVPENLYEFLKEKLKENYLQYVGIITIDENKNVNFRKSFKPKPYKVNKLTPQAVETFYKLKKLRNKIDKKYKVYGELEKEYEETLKKHWEEI